jgi:hypothetical protein
VKNFLPLGKISWQMGELKYKLKVDQRLHPCYWRPWTGSLIFVWLGEGIISLASSTTISLPSNVDNNVPQKALSVRDLHLI